MNSIVNKPSILESGPLRFLVMDSPKESNIHLYLQECKKYNVKHIVRISEPTYRKEPFVEAGISVHEMFYPDGQSPPPEIIFQWLTLVSETFDSEPADKPTIAVHCVAGLGRAPVLIAIALIEYGMDAITAVSYIREKRRGAINAIQLQYLESYRPLRKFGKGKGGCNCM